MLPTLLIAPAASGKTEHCLARVRAVQQDNPLAPIRVILPDRNQVSAFKRRLARQGGAFGVEIGTFQDAYQPILRRATQFLPLASEALTHKLVRTAIESLARTDQLPHYAPIAERAGLTLAVTEIIGELKRALIPPETFTAAVAAGDARLRDLARIYSAYQTALIDLTYADNDGMGWLAVEHLRRDPALASDWQMLIVDGFDSFNGVTFEFIKLCAAGVPEMLVTLSGDATMSRPVYRRFAKTREQLEQTASFEIRTLPRFSGYAAPLRHLETDLFETNAPRLAPTRHVEWIQAQTVPLEAREALRWLKARITRDGVPADECAIIARDLGPYRAFLRQAATEFGMPLRFLGGEPLSQNPAVAALLGVLELPLTWKRRAFLDVLRSPYLDLAQFQLSPADASKFARVAQYGQVIQGLDQWTQALTRLANATEQISYDDDDPIDALRGDPARALLAALTAFAQWFTPPSFAPLAVHVEWLHEKCFRPGGLDVIERVSSAPATYARDASALIELRDAIHTLALAAQTTNETRPLDYATFLGELRGVLNTASYDPDDPDTRRQARIYAGNMNTTRGIPYRAAVILGLSEGIFPAPENEDPFLSDADRTALQLQGLGIEPRLRGTQQTLFYEAVTRAREFLLLTRPYLADDGELWQPSPFWEATLNLFDTPPPPKIRTEQATSLSNAASSAELLQAAVAYPTLPTELTDVLTAWDSVHARAEILNARLAPQIQGAYEGDASVLAALLQARFDAAHIVSPSRLEKYGTCAFYFFISGALDLELVEPPEPGFDARQLGMLYHSILERVYHTAPADADLAALLATLAAVAPPILDAAPDRLGFRPTALWHFERVALLTDLKDTLTALHDASEGFTPLTLEQHFGNRAAPVVIATTAGPIRIRGTIDRVDQNAAGELRIMDYKTGSSGYTPKSFIEGLHLQLPLYAFAAEQTHPGSSVVEGLYWHIRAAKPSTFHLANFHYADDQGREFSGPRGAMALAQEHVGTFITNIRHGTFLPKPPEGGCPTYCPAKNFCWHYDPRQ